MGRRRGAATTGSWSRCGELVTFGFASSALRPSSSAVIMPVTVPTATTTEAATTMAPRRAARLRSALRAARRWARRPDTVLVPLPRRRTRSPFWGSVGPADTAVSL